MRRGLRVALIALLCGNVVAFLAFTLPRALQEQSLESRVQSLKGEIQRNKAQLQALRQRRETIRANELDTDRFYKDIVKAPKEEMLPTIEYVERTAAELGLTAKARSYSQEELKGLGIVRFEIVMPLSGPYRQIVAFLGRLEASRRFLVVDQVQLRVRSDVGGDLAFGLSAYFAEEPETTHGT